MQFTTLLVTFMASAVLATPGYNADGSYFACNPGLYSNPQCCSVDVLGVADLNCASPSRAPSSAPEFQAICASGGQIARCCVLPIAGQDVLCETPVGI
ncbi:hydrophobin precursor [Rostrohypoxylon terebratum]|nr:hydrophobin precursor [Rostrohypoxylon terebratum]